jgi:hypothetical protein
MEPTNTLTPDLPEEEAFQREFQRLSRLAATACPALQLRVPDEIVRNDIIPCLEKALDRPLDLAPRYILNCFAIDASGVITWREFKASLERMRLLRAAVTQPAVSTRSHAKLIAARKKGRPGGLPPQALYPGPITSAQARTFPDTYPSYSQVEVHGCTPYIATVMKRHIILTSAICPGIIAGSGVGGRCGSHPPKRPSALRWYGPICRDKGDGCDERGGGAQHTDVLRGPPRAVLLRTSCLMLCYRLLQY